MFRNLLWIDRERQRQRQRQRETETETETETEIDKRLSRKELANLSYFRSPLFRERFTFFVFNTIWKWFDHRKYCVFRKGLEKETIEVNNLITNQSTLLFGKNSMDSPLHYEH